MFERVWDNSVCEEEFSATRYVMFVELQIWKCPLNIGDIRYITIDIPRSSRFRNVNSANDASKVLWFGWSIHVVANHFRSVSDQVGTSDTMEIQLRAHGYTLVSVATIMGRVSHSICVSEHGE